MEIGFPLEFIVEGVPISLQAKRPSSIAAWKRRVWLAVIAELPEAHWATQGPVSVTILYFPDTAMIGDIDNIVKPILDALRPGVYLNDRQVERVWVQKFEPGGLPAFSDPSPRLLEALEREKPLVYVRIDAGPASGELQW